MIRLTAVIELEGQAPRALTYESANRSITIGRDVAADFQIPLSTISRKHARITETDEVYTIEDLGSTHGTSISGRRLAKGEKKVLHNGDVIELTKAKITCSIEALKIVLAEPGEGTQAIAAKAVQGILGRLGDAKDDGPYLRVLNGADEGVRFAFSGALNEWTLGRSKDCEFVINDPNISRRHAQIKRDWNGFSVFDMGSKNGILVNDRLVKKSRRLHDRDEITIGPIKLVYIDPAAELMDALKDVPGFAMEDQADEPELLDAPATLGAPATAADSGGGLAGQGEVSIDESDHPPSAASAAGAIEDEYSAIDPALLEDVKPGNPIEWIVIAGVGLLFVVALLLLLLLL